MNEEVYDTRRPREIPGCSEAVYAEILRKLACRDSLACGGCDTAATSEATGNRALLATEDRVGQGGADICNKIHRAWTSIPLMPWQDTFFTEVGYSAI